MGNKNKQLEKYKDFLIEEYGMSPSDLEKFLEFNSQIAEDMEIIEKIEDYFLQKTKSEEFNKTLNKLNQKYFNEKQVTIELKNNEIESSKNENRRFTIGKWGKIAAAFFTVLGSTSLFLFINPLKKDQNKLSIVDKHPVSTPIKNPLISKSQAPLLERIKFEKAKENNKFDGNEQTSSKVIKKAIRKRKSSTKLKQKLSPSPIKKNKLTYAEIFENGKQLFLDGEYLECLSTLKEIPKSSSEYIKSQYYMESALADLEHFGLLPQELEKQFKLISLKSTTNEEKIEALTELALSSKNIGTKSPN